MTEEHDRLMEALAGLPPVAPDPECESRVRARCASAISRHSLRRARKSNHHWSSRLIDMACAAALCLYMAAMIAEAVRLRGLL